MFNVHEVVKVVIELEDQKKLLDTPRRVMLSQHCAERGIIIEIGEKYVVNVSECI